tara:strand:- start:306 stop:581 length:276 start_codon:yes stop_codon:yes gene_type:complete
MVTKLSVPNSNNPQTLRRVILNLNLAVEELREQITKIETNLANITSQQATLNAAVDDTGGGSANAGKIVKLDANGKLDGVDMDHALTTEAN